MVLEDGKYSLELRLKSMGSLQWHERRLKSFVVAAFAFEQTRFCANWSTYILISKWSFRQMPTVLRRRVARG